MVELKSVLDEAFQALPGDCIGDTVVAGRSVMARLSNSGRA
jgi:hypothetical protein